MATTEFSKPVDDEIASLDSKLEWKYAGGVIGSGSFDISNLNFYELYIQVDIGNTGNKAIFQIPKLILSANINYFRTGGYYTSQSNELVLISAKSSNIALIEANINGQALTSSSRMFIYYR